VRIHKARAGHEPEKACHKRHYDDHKNAEQPSPFCFAVSVMSAPLKLGLAVHGLNHLLENAMRQARMCSMLFASYIGSGADRGDDIRLGISVFPGCAVASFFIVE